jgi:isopentenyl phosphate kinase
LSAAIEGTHGRELVLIKLGGSLITDKRAEATARPETIARLADELADAWPTSRYLPILGHGSGSFGHGAAARYGVGGGRKVDDPLAAARTAAEAARLHRMVVSALLDAGLPALGWAPSSGWWANGRRRPRAFFEPVLRGVRQGYLPVFYGDVVVDRHLRASIVSTETVSVALAQSARRGGMPVSKAFWLGETDGVYDADGNTIAEVGAANLAATREQLGATAGVDVTGGMDLRLRTAWQLAHRGIESFLVDGRQPGLLAAALRGEDVGGTRIRAV